MQLGDIDRAADRPPYRQIADRLRALIDTGALAAGDQLPSETTLIEHYGVARMTIRAAVQELRNEGRVVAEHGRGTFVRRTTAVGDDRGALIDRMAIWHNELRSIADVLAEHEVILGRLGMRVTDVAEDIRDCIVDLAGQ